jgi:cyclic pyranopterin phosphate synthase
VTLSHVDAQGKPRMVDVGAKPASTREAKAEGSITLSPEAFDLVRAHAGPKGDVLVTAELAGVMGAKRTSELIPLCHPIGIDHVEVRVSLDPDLPGARARSTVRTVGRTGVEMEALTAVSVALLTVYDMVKAAGHGMEIGPIHLTQKTGGTRGDWRRP